MNEMKTKLDYKLNKNKKSFFPRHNVIRSDGRAVLLFLNCQHSHRTHNILSLVTLLPKISNGFSSYIFHMNPYVNEHHSLIQLGLYLTMKHTFNAAINVRNDFFSRSFFPSFLFGSRCCCSISNKIHFDTICLILTPQFILTHRLIDD